MTSRRIAVVVVVLVVVALIAWRYAQPDPVAVAVGDVDRGAVTISVANTRAGTVDACRRAKLAPQAGGQIVALNVREGDRVRAGQVLLELWSDDTSAQVRVAEEQARSAVLRTEEACVRAEMGAREADRARRLNREGLFPEEQLDRALSTAKTLRAACDAAQAEVKQSRARVEMMRATRARTTLRAPFDGVIARVTGEVGEFTTPSPPGIPTPPAVDLIDDSCLFVTAPIDEVDIGKVRVGQPAFITIEALPGRRFAGRVRRVAPFVVDLEKQARTVDVEVEFTNPEDLRGLIVGYSADIEIVIEARENVVRVPTQALMEKGRVLVLPSSPGTLEERQVTTGVSNWEVTEVKSGLREKERVVVSVERKGAVAGARAVVDQ